MAARQKTPARLTLLDGTHLASYITVELQNQPTDFFLIEDNMNLITSHDILLSMAVTLFFLGVIITVTGVVILVTRAIGRDIRTLATQTTHLVQKGLAEDVAGLVGNASALLEAVNQLIRTTAGVGVFLTIFGMLLMGAACWLALQIV